MVLVVALHGLRLRDVGQVTERCSGVIGAAKKAARQQKGLHDGALTSRCYSSSVAAQKV